MLRPSDYATITDPVLAGLRHRLNQAGTTAELKSMGDGTYEIKVALFYGRPLKVLHAYARFTDEDLVDSKVETVVRLRQALEQTLVSQGAKPTDNPDIKWSDPLPVAEPAAVMPSNPSWGIY